MHPSKSPRRESDAARSARADQDWTCTDALSPTHCCIRQISLLGAPYAVSFNCEGQATCPARYAPLDQFSQWRSRQEGVPPIFARAAHLGSWCAVWPLPHLLAARCSLTESSTRCKQPGSPVQPAPGGPPLTGQLAVPDPGLPHHIGRVHRAVHRFL
jgi:hypothetical protein